MSDASLLEALAAREGEQHLSSTTIPELGDIEVQAKTPVSLGTMRKVQALVRGWGGAVGVSGSEGDTVRAMIEICLLNSSGFRIFKTRQQAQLIDRLPVGIWQRVLDELGLNTADAWGWEARLDEAEKQ